MGKGRLRLMGLFRIGAVIFWGVVTATNAPAFEASFRCSEAKTCVEKLICSNEQLAAADREMAERYAVVRESIVLEGRLLLRDSQQEWLKGRLSGCNGEPAAMVRCLKEKYRARNAQIESAKKAAESAYGQPGIAFLRNHGFAAHLDGRLVDLLVRGDKVPPGRRAEARWAVPFLVEEMRGPDAYSRVRAAARIGELLREDGVALFTEILQYGSERQRAAALRGASYLPGPASDALVLRGLTDSRSDVREAAAVQILEMCSIEGVDFRSLVLEDHSERVRAAAVTSLPYVRGLRPEAADLLRKAAEDESQEVRRRAKSALNNLMATLAAGPFPRAAKPAPDYADAFRAELLRLAGAAGSSASPPSRLPDLASLVSELEQVRDSFSGVNAARQLGGLGDKRAVAPLLRVVRSKTASPWKRAAAVEALAQLGATEVAEFLWPLVNLGGGQASWSSALALDHLGAKPRTTRGKVALLFTAGRWDELSELGEPALLELIGGLLTEGRRVVRAAEKSDMVGHSSEDLALGIVGDLANPEGMFRSDGVSADITQLRKLVSALCHIGEKAVPILHRKIAAALAFNKSRVDPIDFVLLMRAMGEIGGSEALRHLVEYERDRNPVATRSSLKSLAVGMNERAVPVFRRALTHPSARVRENAAAALRKSGWTPSNSDEEIRFWIAAPDWRRLECKGWAVVGALISALEIDDGIQQRNMEWLLEKITGESFGSDRASWRRWWEERQTRPAAKPSLHEDTR